MNSFGAGYLVGRAAATAANPLPTPRKFGQLQEVSVDDSFGNKQLFGAGQRPLREFRGQAKTEIKAKFAKINGSMFAELFYQTTASVGATITAPAEIQTVPSSLVGPIGTIPGTPAVGGTSGYTSATALPTTTSGGGSGATITIVASAGVITGGTLVAAGSGYAVGDKVFPTQGSGVGGAYFLVSTITGGVYALTAMNAGAAGINFVEDLGVEYATNGVPLTLVTTTPGVGQYSVSAAGQYVFNVADSTQIVVLCYSYKIATGLTVSVPTLVQQEAPYFEVVLFNPQDTGFQKKFFKCSASKLNQQFKQGDIMIPELDITVLDPGTGVYFVDSYGQI
jgi:hypothetical protein